MIKVMVKAFAIIETLAAAPERQLTVSELAGATGVNKATATRILKDLLDAGYVSQASFRKGYSLGPMAYYLAARGTYRKDIIDASTDVVHECARAIGGAVLVAVLRGGRRFVLCHANGNPEFSIAIENTFYDDLYLTATGKMLLAYAPREEILKYVARKGLPGEVWDGLDSESKLFKRLEGIRRDGLLSYSRTNLGLKLLSFPIFRKGGLDAVLGFCFPLGIPEGEVRKRFLPLGRDAARRIESALDIGTRENTTRTKPKKGF
jgi:DNA-binding IclR family transcriptional regulator